MSKTTVDKIRDLMMLTKREGMTELLDAMGHEFGYLTAPCSGGKHLAKEGGLMEHSWNVYEYADKLASKWLTPEAYKEIYPSLIICAFLHDLGKCGQFGKQEYVPNILKSGKVSDSKPFMINKDLLNVPHEVRSIVLATMYIDLTEEEQFAILYHNGLYGPLKYEVQGNETPLYMILHFADMWVSRVVEGESNE